MSEITPQALSQLDDTLGSRTVESYLTALEVYPHLGGIAVILDTTRGNAFHKSSLGLARSYISINPTEEPYIERLETGVAEERFAWASELLHHDGSTPRVAELLTTIFLHELGHADDYHNHIVASHGNEQAGYEISNTERKSQLATLPLKQATTRAVRAWDNNTEGYRDTMQANGFDEESFQEAINSNRRAYAELPCEAVADRFAQGVLSSIYSLMRTA